MKKSVVLRAPVLSQSGYGVHSRQIARWLLSRSDVELTIVPVQWGVTPWFLDRDAKDGLIGKIMECCKAPKGQFDVSFQVQLPNEWDTRLAAKNVGITAGVETTICNPTWVKCINSMHRVIVPSAFVKSTFEKSGTLNNGGNDVVVIPESFIDEILGDPPPLAMDFTTKFNFLTVGQITGRSSEEDRKNLFNLLKWFSESFRSRDDVGLIIKTNNGRETKMDRMLTTDVINQTLRLVRKGNFPRIHLIHGSMDDAEIAGLYKHPSVRAFVTLTRGEGFGLPILEAAASGLPVIATNWSGHLDFLKHGKFIKLDFELKQLPKSKLDNNIFIPEAKWAEVQEHDVKRKLEKFADSPDTPKQWAQELKDRVRELNSYAAVKKQYDMFWETLVV